MQQTTDLYAHAVKSTSDYTKSFFTLFASENLARIEKVLADMVAGAATATCDPM